jgi:hypothetical protein
VRPNLSSFTIVLFAQYRLLALILVFLNVALKHDLS